MTHLAVALSVHGQLASLLRHRMQHAHCRKAGSSINPQQCVQGWPAHRLPVCCTCAVYISYRWAQMHAPQFLFLVCYTHPHKQTVAAITRSDSSMISEVLAPSPSAPNQASSGSAQPATPAATPAATPVVPVIRTRTGSHVGVTVDNEHPHEAVIRRLRACPPTPADLQRILPAERLNGKCNTSWSWVCTRRSLAAMVQDLEAQEVRPIFGSYFWRVLTVVESPLDLVELYTLADCKSKFTKVGWSRRM